MQQQQEEETGTVEFRSTRVLYQGQFIPARLVCSSGRIVSIIKGENVMNSRAKKVIDCGDAFIGPGLVDIAVDVCLDGWKGGITTIVAKSNVIGFHSSRLNIYQFGPHTSQISSNPNILNAVLIESTDDDDDALERSSNKVYLYADPPTTLSSPFHGKTGPERKLLPGIQWRTGRSRKGSGDEKAGNPKNEEELDGVKMPLEMVQVILERERESYVSAVAIQSSVPVSSSSLSSRSRPAPIVATKLNDSFSPSEFLQDYRVHLSLRPVSMEVQGIRNVIETNARAVLRLSSRDAVESLSSSGVIGGTTVAHLFFSAVGIRSGYTWLKLNPPIRTEIDRQALLARALSKVDEFCLSSGHENRSECYADFERTASNGPCMECSLPALWTICCQSTINEIERMQQFATLWTKHSQAPSHIVGLQQKGEIQIGCDADVIVFSPSKGTVVEPPSVFQGQELLGRVERVFIGQRLVYEH